MEQSLEFKTLLSNIGNVLDSIGAMDQSGIWKPGQGVTVASMDLLRFMMYLAASDDEVSWAEADYMNQAVGLSLTPTQIGDVIRADNIYSLEFEKTVPSTLGLLVTGETLIYQVSGEKPQASKTVLEIFTKVGEEFIKLDGVTNQNVLQNYRNYIGMMEEYMRNNLEGYSGGSKGFKKIGAESSKAEAVTDGVAAPMKDNKGGVTAPKKG